MAFKSYYTTRSTRTKFLVFQDISLIRPHFLDQEKMERFKILLLRSGVCEYLRDIPDVGAFTVLKCHPNTIQFSLRQREPDDPVTLREQIQFYQQILPDHIIIAPYLSKKTVYKFSINLNNKLFDGMDKNF